MGAGDQNREFYLQTVESKSLLDDRFKHIRRIGPHGGGGNFSLLFSAFDTKLGKRVALKFFNPDRRSDAYRWESFEREVMILEKISHLPLVNSLVAPRSGFDQLIPTNTPVNFNLRFDYYASLFVSRDLRTIIEREQWSAERRLKAFRNMCRAVKSVNDLNIAHRDLKPDNFLVTRSGRIRLCDFGTAREIGVAIPQLQPSYQFPVGDLRYASPELLAGLHDVEPSIAFLGDVFALGAILFELFTGEILGLHLQSDPGFGQGLSAVSLTKPSSRVRMYEHVLPLVTNREMPSILDFSDASPPPVLRQVDALYRSMADLDYRAGARESNLEVIIQRVNLCLLHLQNEHKTLLRDRERARTLQWRRIRLARIQRRETVTRRQGGSERWNS